MKESLNDPTHVVQIAPELMGYVDDGRNPDIFLRDFVRNLQRGNAVVNGKQQAFKDSSEIYAKALKESLLGVSRQVDRVMETLDSGRVTAVRPMWRRQMSVHLPRRGIRFQL